MRRFSLKFSAIKIKKTENEKEIVLTFGNETAQGTYQIDKSKNPNWLDINPIDAKRMIGIIEFMTANTFRFQMTENGQRPLDFDQNRQLVLKKWIKIRIFASKFKKMKFVDVKNDIAFRKIFGNEKKKVILISFLNAVLSLEGHNRIKEVILLNPFQLPRIAGEKSSIIDVKATDEKGSTFIVEMQVAESVGFDKRVLYYSSKDYAGQINIGEEYPKLRPVYFIGVLDFKYFSGKSYLSSHLIVDEETGECVFKDLKFRFIELPKFNKKVNELKNIIDKWTFFIKNADELEVMPDNVDDEGLKEAYEEAAQHNWTKEEYDAYIYAGIREQDERGRVEKAEERKRNEMIIGMNAKGIPLSIIAEIANLDEATITQIIGNQ